MEKAVERVEDKIHKVIDKFKHQEEKLVTEFEDVVLYSIKIGFLVVCIIVFQLTIFYNLYDTAKE